MTSCLYSGPSLAVVERCCNIVVEIRVVARGGGGRGVGAGDI